MLVKLPVQSLKESNPVGTTPECERRKTQMGPNEKENWRSTLTAHTSTYIQKMAQGQSRAEPWHILTWST